MGMGTDGWSPSWLRELGPRELGALSQGDWHLKGLELEGDFPAEGSFESRGQHEEAWSMTHTVSGWPAPRRGVRRAGTARS